MNFKTKIIKIEGKNLESFFQNLVPIDIYNNMDEVLPAITLSILSLVFVSLLTKKD